MSVTLAAQSEFRSAEPSEVPSGAALDEQRDVLAKRSTLEPGVVVLDDRGNCFGRHRRKIRPQSLHQLLDDRLFAQLDHLTRFPAISPLVNRSLLTQQDQRVNHGRAESG